MDVVGEAGGAALFCDDFTQGAHVGAAATDAGEGGDGEVVSGVASLYEEFPVGADVDTAEIVAESFACLSHCRDGFDFGAGLGVDFRSGFSFWFGWLQFKNS